MSDTEPAVAAAADDGCAILAALAEDDEHLLPEEYQLLREASKSEAMATASAPLIRVNRSNLRALLANAELPYELRCSLINFLHRYKQSEWMKGQDHYPERIGISLVATWPYGKAMALCGVGHKFCQQVDECPQCASMHRYQPAHYEYGHSFERAPYWYALSPSFEVNPNRAGLHFVTQKRDKKTGIPEQVRRFNPYHGREPGVVLTSDAFLVNGEANPVIACFNTIFQLAEKLHQSGLAGGVFAQREAAWHFCPHRVTPNGHFLVNTKVPLTFDMAVEVLHLFDRLYTRQPLGRFLYPDLHVEALFDQPEVNRWLYYMCKPMDYVTGYRRAVKAGRDIAALNMQVDDRVFQGGAVILSPKSPRRYGNLSCQGEGYIGAGSITVWRQEQAAQRKAQRERQGLPKPQPPPKESRLSRIIDREAHRRHKEF